MLEVSCEELMACFVTEKEIVYVSYVGDAHIERSSKQGRDPASCNYCMAVNVAARSILNGYCNCCRVVNIAVCSIHKDCCRRCKGVNVPTPSSTTTVNAAREPTITKTPKYSMYLTRLIQRTRDNQTTARPMPLLDL